MSIRQPSSRVTTGVLKEDIPLAPAPHDPSLVQISKRARKYNKPFQVTLLFEGNYYRAGVERKWIFRHGGMKILNQVLKVGMQVGRQGFHVLRQKGQLIPLTLEQVAVLHPQRITHAKLAKGSKVGGLGDLKTVAEERAKTLGLSFSAYLRWLVRADLATAAIGSSEEGAE